MRLIILTVIAAGALALGLQGTARSHCEVPCGVYGDLMRIQMLREDLATIEKAMVQIHDLGNAEKPNYNQIVRWTTTKDDHANKVQHIVTQYFMTQRIKPNQEKYVEKLTKLHAMLLSAMKSKQTIDVKHVADLRTQIEDFSKLYFSKEDLEHLKHHHDG